jgi:hypothetical protein
VKQSEGVLGKIPWEGTRVEDLEVGNGGDANQGGEETDGEFPPLSQRPGVTLSDSTPIPHPHLPHSPPNPRSGGETFEIQQNRSFQPIIDRFVGYFRSKSKRRAPKSYAEAVRVESTQASMVHPAASRGGVRREGFGAGRGGRGLVEQAGEAWCGKYPKGGMEKKG